MAFKVILDGKTVEFKELDEASAYYGDNYKSANKIELRKGSRLICRKASN